MQSKWCLLVIVVTQWCCLGCGGAGKPQLFSVTGVVTLNGEAINEGTVSFSSPNTGNGAIAQLQSDGTFAVRGGMLPGDYKVTITPPAPTPQDPKMKESKIPARYRTPAQTDLVATIKPQGEKLKFDLKP